MQVRGLTYEPSPEDFTAKCVHTDLPSAGTFHCSMPKLNELNAAVRRTLLNSIHGIPGEEPTREKMGWTLDAAVVMESYLYNFDALNAYKKALRDFRDAQAPTGHIPSTVPSAGWGYVHEDGSLDYWDDPWWGGSIFLLADKLYLHTGDVGVLEYAFPALKAYVDFLTSTARRPYRYMVAGRLARPESRHHQPGVEPDARGADLDRGLLLDEPPPGRIRRNPRLRPAAVGALRGARRTDPGAVQPGVPRSPDRHLCGEFADGAGAAAGSRARADTLKAKVGQRLLDAIDLRDGHISAGFIGGNFTMDYLPRSGRFDVAYRMLTRPESPGWLHMVQSERSTMSESINQNGPGSGHHPYGAYIGFWLYKYLGGIRPDEAKPGFREFVIEPGLDSGLAEVSVGCRSLYGEIVSAWKRRDGGGTLTIRVPANTVAELILPAGAVGRNPRVNGVRLRDIPSIAPIPSSGDGKIRYSVGSGTYEFELR